MVKRVSTNKKQQNFSENGSLKDDDVKEQPSEERIQENRHVSDPESDVDANSDTDSSSVYSALEEEEEDDDTSSSEGEVEDADEQNESLSDLEDEEVGDIEMNPNMALELSKPVVDEYEYDSSDEEDIRNTVGNIPMEWYDDYDHLGYDWDGKKIMKPASTDELDDFLSKMDDPYYWRTVNDPMTGRNVILSNRDVEMIKQIQKGRYPDKNYDPYAPWIDFFTHETMIHPVSNRPEHKRSFVPSYIEKAKVSRYVYRMKMGRLKPQPPKTEDDDDKPKYYLMWEKNDDPVHKRIQNRIPAPRMKLPGHEESYNPPPEYLFTPEEEEKWKNQEPHLRKLNFIPQKYSSLRAVPAYKMFVRERFERCLDLYLCPRQRKMKLNIDPEDLIPKLPKPKDLQPFPTKLTLIYKGNKDKVRCLTVEPYGQFLASGCDDGIVKIWEVLTGRCFGSIKMEGAIKSIAWCPNASICAIAVAVNNNVVILNPKVGDKLVFGNTDQLLGTQLNAYKAGKSSSVVWRLATDKEHMKGYRIVIEHPKEVKQVTWHCKGDYFATVMSNAANKSVLMHQLTKRHSQEPFRRSKGLVQCVLFHPIRPFFFVATQRYVRIYNLMKQELSKKLMANCKWISSMAVHPAGDNLIIGSYDSRLSWFDLDLSSKPYQTLRHHKKALRQVSYHRRYPLFASASDDTSVIVCHGAVYNDFLQNPLIVPVKVLRGHSTKDDLGVLDCQFHPTQPWIFTSGADGHIFLYT